MKTKLGLLGIGLAVMLLVSGCGQGLKQENEQLKATVSTLTEKNNGLENKVASLQKEVDDVKSKLTTITAERDALQKQLETMKKPAAKAKKAKKKK